ncbi:hypothetical protein [Aphanizomenon flos-aquae]|uniref:hypothetical protein n=1 Tax=Aphanizomenon flos-aquae TaxID=1176 RepID=UPI000A6A81E3|nr:hypothetical protein [Aphanizomenon flos-aquae]
MIIFECSDRTPASPHPQNSELLAAALVPSGTLRERYRTPKIQNSDRTPTIPHIPKANCLQQRFAIAPSPTAQNYSSFILRAC